MILVAGLVCPGVHRHTGHRTDHKIQHPLPSALPTDAISYASVSINPLRRHIRLEKLRLGPPDAARRVTIDTLTVRRWSTTDGIPTDLHLEIKGLRVDSDHPWCHRLLPLLQEPGCAKLLAHIEIAYRFNRPQKVWDVHQLRITAPGLGELELKLSLGNIDLIRLLRKPRDGVYLLQVLPRAAIREASLSYRDDSLLRRLYRRPLGAGRGRLDETFREVLQRLDRKAEQTADPADRQALEGLRDFFADPDSLEAQMRPQRPVALRRLLLTGDIRALVKLLGLQIRGCKRRPQDRPLS